MSQSPFDLNLLPCLVAIYKYKSLTKAARHLGMAGSTLSLKLSQLRELYQDPLFIGNGRELVPTTTMQTLFPVIDDLLGRCRQVIPNHGLDLKKVTIGMSDDFECVIGRLIVDAFSASLPGITPIIVQLNSQFAESYLLSRSIHFAITGGGTHSNSVIREQFGFHYDCCLYEKELTKSSDKPDKLSLEEYLNRPHVVVHYGSLSGVADSILGNKRKIDVMTSHYSDVVQYLFGTQRVCLVPVTFAQKIVQKYPTFTYCPIPFTTTQDPVELSYRTGLSQIPLMHKVLGILRQILKSVAWEVTPASSCN